MICIRTVLGFGLICVVVACAPATKPRDGGPTCGLLARDLGSYATIPAGSFVMGARPVYPEEGPPLRLQVTGFQLQRHEVTNDQFAAFVSATGYVTDAETSAAKGQADGGSGLFVRPGMGKSSIEGWILSSGANWRMPEGAGSSLDGRGNAPVVHVSYRDAAAYAHWAKARLPSSVEWEYAAHLGLPDPEDSRSGAFEKDGKPRANTWQGLFPIQDEGSDGFKGVAPVGCFTPDRLGLSDMIGNVWEWTAMSAPSATQSMVKGGSHLCTDSFCGRFRPEAHQLQDIDFSTNHIGFRVARDIP
jgi:formylglycine-generating enzyme